MIHESATRSLPPVSSAAPRASAPAAPAAADVAVAARLDRATNAHVRDDALGGLLSSAVARRRDAALLQRWVDEASDDGAWRRSNDMTVAIRANAQRELWAKAGKAATANVMLKAVGSGIRLLETEQQHEFAAGDGSRATLKRIVPRDVVAETTGNRMELWADCMRAARFIVGSDEMSAEYLQPRKAGRGDRLTLPIEDPARMKIHIMREWLDAERIALAFDRTGKKARIVAALGAGDALRDALKDETQQLVDEGRQDEYEAKLAKVAEAYFAYYDSFDPAGKTAIAQTLGINSSVRPAVGQGFVISSAGAGLDAWRWGAHWGAVVMKSDDDADSVVLQNYATGDFEEKNSAWRFDMYGDIHADLAATKKFGTAPTTMLVKKRE